MSAWKALGVLAALGAAVLGIRKVFTDELVAQRSATEEAS